MAVSSPPAGLRRLNPMLYYPDIRLALDWLQRVFGFLPGEIAVCSNGDIDFAEVSFGGEIIILSGGFPSLRGKPPTESGSYSQHLHVYVDDIHRHYDRCVVEGANCLTLPKYMYWGDIIFRVEDCGHHMWTFAQHIKDVATEDLKPPG